MTYTVLNKDRLSLLSRSLTRDFESGIMEDHEMLYLLKVPDTSRSYGIDCNAKACGIAEYK